MKLLKGAVSVSVDVDVGKCLTVGLRVAEVMVWNHAGELMTILVDIVRESVNVCVMQPLIVVDQKAAQLLQKRLAKKQKICVQHGANESVAVNVVQDRVRTKTARTEGQALLLACKLHLFLNLKLAQLLKMTPTFK